MEIVMINDGATDGTDETIQKYIKRSGMNIRYFIQENMGVSAARNRGIKESRGRYLIFLDADDTLAYGYVNLLTRILSERNPDTICCHRTKDKTTLAKHLGESAAKEVTSGELLTEYTYSKEKLGFQCFLYKKDLIISKRIRFPEDIRLGEDVEFLTKYLANCRSAYEIEEDCYYYRQNPVSASFRADYGHAELIIASERTAYYLKQMGHPFADRFKEYMRNRSIFHAAHKFAQAKDRSLMKRLEEEYPVKEAMKFIATDRDCDKRSRLAAKAYLISPALFFFAAGRKY